MFRTKDYPLIAKLKETACWFIMHILNGLLTYQILLCQDRGFLIEYELWNAMNLFQLLLKNVELEPLYLQNIIVRLLPFQNLHLLNLDLFLRHAWNTSQLFNLPLSLLTNSQDVCMLQNDFNQIASTFYNFINIFCIPFKFQMLILNRRKCSEKVFILSFWFIIIKLFQEYL